ncbi:MAG: hypothetical protein JJU00_12840 [Opitutales bacterium]|nr:hypothetical protein [Opitutales bacterium]
MNRSAVLLAFVFLLPAFSLTAGVRYPAGVVIDVTAAPYFADPTGTADNRAILQQVLDDHPGSMLERPIIYFPDGTYRLSGGLVVDTHNQPDGGSGRGVVFQGQSRDGTILQLDDDAAGFGDPAEPQVFIDFNEANDVGGWQYVAFQTHLKDLTIDVGAGNAGAIGLDFCANNVGGLRHVRVRSSDPERAGRYGILLSAIPGPQLFKHVEVIGFDWALRTENDPHYATTIEDLVIREAREGGIFNRRHSFAIHRLRTENLGGPALRNDHADAFVVLIDAQIMEGPGTGAALFNNGFLYVRNVVTEGYAGVIDDRAVGLIAQANMSEWHYGTAEGLFDTNVRHSLRLPIADAPEPPRDDPVDWVNVVDFGATPGDDFNNDALGVQAAIDSMAPGGVNAGKRTLYFHPCLYRFDTGVVISEHVERIVGCFASILPRQAAIQTQPVWRIVDGDRLLIIEQLTGHPGGPLRATPFIRNESNRDLVLRDVLVLAGQTYVNTGAGRLFMENVGGTSSRYWSNEPQPLPEAIPQFDFGGQTVWARQLNTEQKDLKVRNDGGDLWILGIKNEEDGTYVQTLNGGRTEILGGTAMPLDVDDFDSPGFEIIDASMSIIIAGHMGWARDHYEILVRETRDGETRDLMGVDVVHKRTYANSAGLRPPVLALYRGSVLSEAEHWRRTHFGTTANAGDAADRADPDNDGLANRLERALGGQPLQPGSGQRPEFDTIALNGSVYPTLSFRRLVGGTDQPGALYEAEGLRYSVEHSDDLAAWTSGAAAVVLHETPFDEGDGMESVTVRGLRAIEPDIPAFLRLMIEDAP